MTPEQASEQLYNNLKENFAAQYMFYKELSKKHADNELALARSAARFFAEGLAITFTGNPNGKEFEKTTVDIMKYVIENFGKAKDHD